MSQSFTRQFAPPAPQGFDTKKFDPRYCQAVTTWQTVYEKNGELLYEIFTCGPQESPKSYLDGIEINLLNGDAIVELVK